MTSRSTPGTTDSSAPLELDPEVLEAATELYRELHRHPELGWDEFESAARVRRFLTEHEVPVSDCSVRPSVVADIQGHAPGGRVLIRADLDALPIEEETDLPFRSQVEGVMHACGHDLHSAILAALAVHQHRRRNTFGGSLRLVWQPSEEANPSGAEALVRAGLADGCQAALALHVDPRLQVGRVSYKDGVTNAAVDGVGITLRGPGGHGARPHLAPDIVRVCALLVLELKDLVRRTVRAQEAAVLTITTIQTGKRSNIIPDQAWIDGTLRTFSSETRESMIAGIRRVLDAITGLHDIEYEFDLRVGQPALVNDVELTRLTTEMAHAVLGPESVVVMPEPSVGADDFSVFGDKAPIMMIRLGTYDGEGPPADLHTPRFRANLDAMPIGIRLLSSVAERITRTN